MSASLFRVTRKVTSPTVLPKINGFDVRIYSRDHEPPHVYCWKQRSELVVSLKPINIRENNRMSPADARRALAIITEHQSFLLAEWRRIHP